MKLRHWIAIGVAIGLVGVVALGLWLAHSTKPPPLVLESIVVRARADGLSPLEVEAAVTTPIESAISPLDGVVAIESTSSEGVSSVEVLVAPGADPSKVRDTVLDALLLTELAQGTTRPFVLQLVRREVRWVWLDAPSAAPQNVDAVRERLETTDDVRAVSTCGLKTRDVRVTLDEARLAAHRFTPRDVIAALDPAKLVEADLLQAPIKSDVHLGDVASIETKESTPCRATHRGAAEGVLVTVDVGTKHASDAKIRAEGQSFGFDKDAFRVDFAPAEGLHAADVDRLARDAGAKDVIVLERPDPKGMVAYGAVVIAPKLCAVAEKLELSLAARTPVRVFACGLDDDERALRFVGPDVDVLSTAAKGALETARSHGAVAFIEGDEKSSFTVLQLDDAATPDDRTRLYDARRLTTNGIQVGTTDKGNAVVFVLPPGPPKIDHSTATVKQMPTVIRHVNNHRVVRLRFVGDGAREDAVWVAQHAKVPTGVLVLTR